MGMCKFNVMRSFNTSTKHTLCDTDVYPNDFGTIIANCGALAHSLGDVSFFFVRRSAKTAAHTIARVGGFYVRSE